MTLVRQYYGICGFDVTLIIYDDRTMSKLVNFKISLKMYGT